jgi:hypothetical protein
MSTGAAPPREALTPPAAAPAAVTQAAIQAAAVALAYDRVQVTTTPAPPPPAPFAGMGFTDFQDRYLGKYTILPGYSRAECVAIFRHFNTFATHGDPYSAPGAQDLWNINWTRYDRIPPGEPARAGDAAIWSGSFGDYRGGGWGHVAIVLADHGDTLTAISQNPNPAAVMTLTKPGLLGYLRPHQLNP